VAYLSTYVAGGLAVVLMMDFAPRLTADRALSDLYPWPAEIAEPAAAVNRALKGDRVSPVRIERRSGPTNAPLEVVDLPTGSIGKRAARAAPVPTGWGNVTAIVKKAAPAREERPGKLRPGCESAFGRLAAPPLAHVPGRCVV
jgi:hypothetical protein